MSKSMTEGRNCYCRLVVVGKLCENAPLSFFKRASDEKSLRHNNVQWMNHLFSVFSFLFFSCSVL
jgi:hypothetical protein